MVIIQQRFRIVFVSPGPQAQGGIAMVVENYRKSSFWQRHECSHFGTCSGSKSRAFSAAYTLFSLLKFTFQIIIRRPRAISVHVSSGTSFYRKSLFALCSRVLRVPVIFHIHPSHFYEFYNNGSSLNRSYIRWILEMGAGLVFLTEGMANKFKSRFPTLDIDVVPNPVPVVDYQSEPRAPMKGNHTLLFLGWITKSKGVFDIVEIIGDVAEHYPDVRFVFAGNKEVGGLRELIQARKLQKNTEVLDWVETEEKLRLLLNSRIILLPTYTEGIPNVLLEAMASGLPAITTPVGGIPSIFEESVNGYYVSPGDKDQLRETVLKLLGDDADCERLSRATLLKSRNYDVEVIGRRLEALYDDFLETMH